MAILQASTLRYRLPQKAIKGDCPDCSPKHRKTLSRYVDAQTGEALPSSYGRCDRESNCGYHLSPYTKSPSGLSYADELYQSAMQANEQDSRFQQRPRSQSYNSSITASLPIKSSAIIHSLPDEVFTKSLGHYEQNQFARLLMNQFGAEVARHLLDKFQIGSSKCWNNAGACVFWLIDEQNRKRGGQVKLFDDTFHTVKYLDRDGRKRTRTSWVHAVLSYQYHKAQQSQPAWLTDYIEQADFAPCLFGLPQLNTESLDKPIAIVEAPKTAVLCTPYFPQFIWMAVIGRSYLNAERLIPLKGRSIVLFPDLAKEGKDYQYWKTKADGLQQQGFQVMVSDYLEKIATDEDRQRGMDLADFLLMPNPYVFNLDEWQAGTILRPTESQLERLEVEPCNSYPAEWDGYRPAIGQPQRPKSPHTRTSFPLAPVAYDASEQLRRIQGCVIPIKIEETDYCSEPSSLSSQLILA